VSVKQSLNPPSTIAQLPNHWRWERLDAICSGTFNCPHSTPLLTDRGPYVVRSQDVRSGVFRADEAGQVSEETYAERNARAEPCHGDLVYSREGTYFGIAAEVPPGVRLCLGQRMVLLRPDDSKVHFRFLRYWLNSPVMASRIHGYRDGSVAERLNLPTIPALPVIVPLLPEQRAIAHILGTFDDKIEINRRMNQTLEAMAQALFKSWFMDPTQDGLPKGWRESTIGEEVRVAGGSTPSTSRPEFWAGGTYYWATPKDLAPLTSPVLLDTERKITELGVEQISSGLLPAGTVLLSSRAPIGYLAIAETPISINQGFIAMVCEKDLPNHLVRLWTQQNMDAIKGRANGTTFLEISKTNFRPIPVAVPPRPLLREFQKQAEALHQRVVANLRESRTLAQLRDTLLPKLLAGELRIPAHLVQAGVPAVEKSLEAVVCPPTGRT
jgi:type I restriction enzyme S subunit